MKRRTLLQSIAAFVATRPLWPLNLFAQAPPLTDANVATLRAIAEVVLPSSLGADGHERATKRFVAWVRNYKEGVDTGYGYGDSRVNRPTGPSPAPRYDAQFAALDEAARAQGGTTFAKLPADKRRVVIEAALNTPQQVTALPGRPNGTSLVADFMGYYYASPEANDLCYQAQIGRDTCRTLDGSDREPAPLGRS
jgi:Gluconate 2-dehydrogenase subunit 3